jgi:hypothetical protein
MSRKYIFQVLYIVGVDKENEVELLVLRIGNQEVLLADDFPQLVEHNYCHHA